jgi:hypothetical protein
LAKPTDNKMQKIRDQRVVVDELTAQLILCAPSDYARIKARLDEANTELTTLEAHWSKPPRIGPPRSTKPGAKKRAKKKSR